MKLKKTTVLTGNHVKGVGGGRDRAASDFVDMNKNLHFKGELRHHLGVGNTEGKVYVKK